jgi:hypothetical protein
MPNIGSKTVCPGVKATANRLKEIEANCRNIIGMRPTITHVD